MTLADTIRAALLKHCESGGVVLGQNLKQTPESVCVPVHPNVIDLPTSDCSNGGVACGYALAGKRPVYVIRYAPFGHYNLCSILNYAAKSKTLWTQPCPVFIRGIATEGGVGPVASGPMHSQVMRMPGIRVYAPMTPSEWKESWEWFLEHDEPVYCSEHRSSYQNKDSDAYGVLDYGAPITVVAISKARHSATELSQELRRALVPVWKLKPFELTLREWSMVDNAKRILIIDSDYPTCGAAEHVAQQLHERTGARVWTLGLEDRVHGFSPDTDNVTPSVERIVAKIKEIQG